MRRRLSPATHIVIAAALGLILLGALIGMAKAQDLVPRWSYGPTLAMTAIRQGPGGTYHNEFLTGGAGVQINLNLVDAANFPWISIGNPWLLGGNSQDNLFRISPGLTLTIVGNLTIGAAYDLFKSVDGEGTGLMTGQSSWQENGTILVGLQVPIGSNAGIWTMGR